MTAEEKIEAVEVWYAVRIRRLQDLCKKHGCWEEAAAILANETADPVEPRSYSHLLLDREVKARDAERDLILAWLDRQGGRSAWVCRDGIARGEHRWMKAKEDAT